MSNTNSDFSSMQDRNQQTLADIANLQEIEQELYSSLEKNATTNSLSQEEKNQIVNKINEISQIRINLYANLKNTYVFFQQSASSSRVALAEQMMAIDIVENELNESKRRLRLLEDEKYNKLRLVEINTYYGKQYNAHAGIMKLIVIICIPILIVGVLANMGIIPKNIAALLSSIIIIIGLIIIGRRVLDLMNRDNMNFDEYNWKFNTQNAPADNTDISSATDPWKIPTRVCIGPECCNEYSTYDAIQNICVPNTNSSITNTDNSSSSSQTSR